MAVTAIQYGWLWAQNSDGHYEYSLTVQVPNVAAYCEIALTSHWQLGDDGFDASSAFITQCVSASGVEEFEKENRTWSPLCFSLFRERITSVTFKASAYHSKAMCRWAIFQWGTNRLWDMFRRARVAASEANPRQTVFLYDRSNGEVVHVHQFAPLDPDTRLNEEEMRHGALIQAGSARPHTKLAALHARKGMQLNPSKRYRVDLKTGKLITEAAEQLPPRQPPKRRR